MINKILDVLPEVQTWEKIVTKESLGILYICILKKRIVLLLQFMLIPFDIDVFNM